MPPDCGVSVIGVVVVGSVVVGGVVDGAVVVGAVVVGPVVIDVGCVEEGEVLVGSGSPHPITAKSNTRISAREKKICNLRMVILYLLIL